MTEEHGRIGVQNFKWTGKDRGNPWTQGRDVAQVRAVVGRRLSGRMSAGDDSSQEGKNLQRHAGSTKPTRISKRGECSTSPPRGVDDCCHHCGCRSSSGSRRGPSSPVAPQIPSRGLRHAADSHHRHKDQATSKRSRCHGRAIKHEEERSHTDCVPPEGNRRGWKRGTSRSANEGEAERQPLELRCESARTQRARDAGSCEDLQRTHTATELAFRRHVRNDGNSSKRDYQEQKASRPRGRSGDEECRDGSFEEHVVPVGKSLDADSSQKSQNLQLDASTKLDEVMRKLSVRGITNSRALLEDGNGSEGVCKRSPPTRWGKTDQEIRKEDGGHSFAWDEEAGGGSTLERESRWLQLEESSGGGWEGVASLERDLKSRAAKLSADYQYACSSPILPLPCPFLVRLVSLPECFGSFRLLEERKYEAVLQQVEVELHREADAEITRIENFANKKAEAAMAALLEEFQRVANHHAAVASGLDAQIRSLQDARARAFRTLEDVQQQYESSRQQLCSTMVQGIHAQRKRVKMKVEEQLGILRRELESHLEKQTSRLRG